MNATDSPDIGMFAADAYVLDGAVIVQMLAPGCCKTFADYKSMVFIPHLMSYLKRSNRVNVIFDVYCQSSLKYTCREKRGSGIRTHVAADTRMPSNWQQFLHVAENKQELFSFLADGSIPAGSRSDALVLITQGVNVNILAGQTNLDSIAPCTHEEADTRLLLHCMHASHSGCKRVAIRTVDTDVVVIATYCFDKLQVEELWIHFGVGKNVRLIPIHDVVVALGPQKCQALPLFHALTGWTPCPAFWQGQKVSLGCMECVSRSHQRTSLLIGKWH